MTTKMQKIFTHNPSLLNDADSTLASFKLASCDLVDDALLCAIRDARQTCDKALRQEALTWLWICCPDIADELGLPTPETALEAVSKVKETQPEVIDYFRRDAVFSLA